MQSGRGDIGDTTGLILMKRGGIMRLGTIDRHLNHNTDWLDEGAVIKG